MIYCVEYGYILLCSIWMFLLSNSVCCQWEERIRDREESQKFYASVGVLTSPKRILTDYLRVKKELKKKSCVKKNLNASRPSEHPPVCYHRHVKHGGGGMNNSNFVEFLSKQPKSSQPNDPMFHPN